MFNVSQEQRRAFEDSLDDITSFARRRLAYIPRGARRDDAVQEAVAHAWHLYCRVAHAGKDAVTLLPAVIRYAVRRVKSGRPFAGAWRSRDVFINASGPQADVVIHQLLEHTNDVCIGVRDDILADRHEGDPSEQAAFRVDWPRFLRTRTKRDRSIARMLGRGERANVVARTHGLTPARVTQIRRELREDWFAFVL